MKVNANRISQTDLMQAQSAMGMVGKMQKIGKGKRKYKVNFDKTTKKYLAKIVKEYTKQAEIYRANPQTKGVADFFEYLERECARATAQPIMLSFEELDFLKSTIAESIKAMEGIQYKWYNFIKKSFTKLMIKQNRYILNELKK